MHKKCQRCQSVRQFLFVAGSGFVAGMLAVQLGMSRDMSMFLTFGGAILPLVWFMRNNRD